MDSAPTYDSNLLKGTGVVEETLVLLSAYEKGISKQDFFSKVFELDLLSKATERRVNDLVRGVFFRRYWRDGIDVPWHLKKLRERHISINVIKQVFLVYTCRANPILGDFIRERYNGFVEKGYQLLEKEDYTSFIREAIKDSRIERAWNENTINEVAIRMNACLADFGLLSEDRAILPYPVYETTANYLAHELHFRGYTDDQMLHHPDWQLFGLHTSQVAELLQRLSWQGHFIFQYSGELLKISWKYQTMEAFIDGLTNQ